MSLIKYKDFLTLCKEKMAEAVAPLRVREMRKKAELELCKLESSIAEKEQSIHELGSSYPVYFDALIDAIDELDLTIRRKEQFEKIISEMFPED